MSQSKTPRVLLRSVSPPPLSLATTRGISVDFFSSGYLDVSVPRVPYVNLWIQLTFHDSSSWGFPHSEIHGSMLIYSSPWLIAVSHVLLRLLMPRHSPYALLRLNFLTAYSCSFSLNCLSFTLQTLFWFSVKRRILSYIPFCWFFFHQAISRIGEIVVITQIWKDLK